jgi:hypothetical protein
MSDYIRECVDKALIIVTPRPRCGVDWDGLKWEIVIHAHPEYADDGFDFPIELREGDSKEAIELFPENAEDLGRALIRAAEIRRKILADELARNKPETGT